MATYVTTVLFIVIMDIAVLYFHNSCKCCLVLEIVTGEYVYLSTAAIELII